MSNFADCFLVKLSPDDRFIALSSYDICHGKSSRFLLEKSKLAELLSPNAESVLDTDIGSYLQLIRKKAAVQFRLTFLHQNYRNDVTGYVLTFDLPIGQIHSLLNGKQIHHVEYMTAGQRKAKLFLTDSGHQKLHHYCQDKLTRHALRSFFRDSFNYDEDEKLVIHPDSWVKGFYFESDTGFNGGIVRHETTIKGKDGKVYPKVSFAVHT